MTGRKASHRGTRDRESKTQGNECLSSPVLWAQVLALNIGVQRRGDSGTQGPAGASLAKAAQNLLGEPQFLSPLLQ